VVVGAGAGAEVVGVGVGTTARRLLLGRAARRATVLGAWAARVTPVRAFVLGSRLGVAAVSTTVGDASCDATGSTCAVRGVEATGFEWW
jgi:hypothetical protein